MCGYHSSSRSASLSPRRDHNDSASSDDVNNRRKVSRRRRSRSHDRSKRYQASSRFDNQKIDPKGLRHGPTSRYDNRSRGRSRSPERRRQERRRDSRSRSPERRRQERRRDSRSRSRTRNRSPRRDGRGGRERSRSRDRTGTDGSVPIDRNSYFFVSHRDNVVRLAGKIAWIVRRNENLKPLVASGPAAIATALGVIARARHFLSEDKSPAELLFLPKFQSNRGNREKIIFNLKTESGQRHDPSGGQEDSLTVSSRSKIAPIAGAIARRARENGVGVLLEAIGDDAVQTCVCALAMAREFLKDDDITFSSVVTLEELQKKGNDGILRELINFKVKCYLDPKISI